MHSSWLNAIAAFKKTAAAAVRATGGARYVASIEQAMTSAGDVSPAYFSYHLSSSYNDGLLHLPYALEFAREQGDSEGAIGEAIAGYVYAFQAELAGMRVMRDVANLLRMLMDILAEASMCGSTAEGNELGLGLGAVPPLDMFLDALRSRKVLYDEKDLFGLLFADWVNAFGNARLSAGVLSFLLRLRVWPGEQKLYRDNWVLGFAFNPALCSKHWEAAHEIIRGECPPWYVELMERYLLHP